MKLQLLFILIFCLTSSSFSKEKRFEVRTLEDCNIYIKNNPNDSLGYFIRADLLWNTNKELALSDLETAKKKNKDSCPIDFITINENWRDYSYAYYEIADRLYSKWARPSKLLDDATKRRIGTQALHCIDRAISFNSDEQRFHQLRAEIYEEMLNDIKSAIKEYDMLIELAPIIERRSKWYSNLSNEWYYNYYFKLRKELKVKIKDYVGAKSDYLALHQKFPNNPDYLWELGNMESLLKNYSMAEAYYSQAIEKSKYDEIDRYYQRARLRIEMKNYKGALEDYDKVFAIDSRRRSSNQYYERANAKRFLKDYSGALKDYDESLLSYSPNKHYPSDAYHFYDRGRTKFLLKDFKGAYEDCTKAIQINSALGIFYQARAYAAIQMNDYQAAKMDLLLASDLLPENKEIQTDLEVLEILLRDSR